MFAIKSLCIRGITSRFFFTWARPEGKPERRLRVGRGREVPPKSGRGGIHKVRAQESYLLQGLKLSLAATAMPWSALPGCCSCNSSVMSMHPNTAATVMMWGCFGYLGNEGAGVPKCFPY